MSKGMRLAAIVAAGLVLSGCATPEVPYDKSQAANIRSIGILTLAMPEKPTVFLASDLGQSFGLVGGLIDAGIQAHRDAAFWKSIDGARNPPTSAFLDALSKSLRDRGFEVTQVAVARPDGNLLQTYPKAGNGVDAYLDIAFIGNGYGYVAAGMAKSNPFRPYAYIKCRLVRASDGATLMQDTVLDNGINTPKNVVTISPNPAFEFTNFDSLNGDPLKAASGMDDAFRQTTEMIGTLLH